MIYFKINKVKKSEDKKLFDFYFWSLIKGDDGVVRMNYEWKNAQLFYVVFFGIEVRFKKVEKKITLPFNIKVEVSKFWRDDLKKWQSEYKLFKVPFFYKYTIAINGGNKIKTELSFFKKNKAAEKIIKPFDLPLPRVGQQEFKEVYNSIKGMMPINKVLDLKLP